MQYILMPFINTLFASYMANWRHEFDVCRLLALASLLDWLFSSCGVSLRLYDPLPPPSGVESETASTYIDHQTYPSILNCVVDIEFQLFYYFYNSHKSQIKI